MKRNRQFVLGITMVSCCIVVFFSELYSAIKLIALVLYLLIILSICFALMLENRSPYKTLLWIYAILFFPIVGYIFYIYSGQLEVKGHLFKQMRLQNWEQEKKMMQIYHNPSDQWNDLMDTEREFSKLITKLSDQVISFNSSTEVLRNGDEKFPRLIYSLQKATDYIHLQYYIFRADEIGNKLLSILCEKALQGVEVRFIFDGIGSMLFPKHELAKLKKAGVHVHTFLPIRFGFLNQKFNFRNHRKIVVIDGSIGFVGGLNVGDEYLGKDPKVGYWRDTHLLLKGEALQDLHRIFLLDWNYVSGETLSLEHYMFVEPCIGTGGVQVVPSGPDTYQGMMSYLYYSMIAFATKSVWITTPYFIPSKEIRTALLLAAVRGIDVRLMVPEVNDGFLTQYATRSYFHELLKHGVKIYLYQKGFHHQKTIIIDKSFAVLGTTNVDLRSFHLNFEVNVFMFRTPTVQTLVTHYTEDLGDSVELELETYRTRGLVVRTKESFARLFSPIL